MLLSARGPWLLSALFIASSDALPWFDAIIRLHFSEPYGVESAAFQIIRGGVIPMDMATVQLGNGTSTYMTLLAGWGIVADIDIESEKFRKLGKSRFLLGALLWERKGGSDGK